VRRKEGAEVPGYRLRNLTVRWTVAAMLFALSTPGAGEPTPDPRFTRQDLTIVYSHGWSVRLFRFWSPNPSSQGRLLVALWGMHGLQFEEAIDVRLSGTANREIRLAIEAADLAFDDMQYWTKVPTPTIELDHIRPAVGVLVLDGRSVTGSPLSNWINSRNSPQANRTAWLLQLLERLRWEEAATAKPTSRDEVRNVLKEVQEVQPQAIYPGLLDDMLNSLAEPPQR